MRGKKSNKRAPLFSVTHLGLLLLCLVMVTGHFAGGIYAKYASEDGGDDTGHVISFGELVVTEINELLVAPGGTIQRESYVSFGGSEAQTYLFVRIDCDKKVWKWSSDGTELKTIATYTDEHGNDNVSIVKFKMLSNWNKLESNFESNVESYEGVFYLEVPSNTVVNNVPVFDNSGVVDLPARSMDELNVLVGTSILVEAIVVQANGFDNVQAAWDAVKGDIA